MACGGGRLGLQYLFVLALGFGAHWVGAQVHHVVGGDRGWDPSTDVAAWSSGKTFRVGDKIWFSYSAAQESIAEVMSREEYESCDVRKAVRMYRDGIDSITLDGEGARYFASQSRENCKNGLKLKVEVEPRGMEPDPDRTPPISTSEASAMMVMTATAPASPSHSTQTAAATALVLTLIALSFCFFVVTV